MVTTIKQRNLWYKQDIKTGMYVIQTDEAPEQIDNENGGELSTKTYKIGWQFGTVEPNESKDDAKYNYSSGYTLATMSDGKTTMFSNVEQLRDFFNAQSNLNFRPATRRELEKIIAWQFQDK